MQALPSEGFQTQLLWLTVKLSWRWEAGSIAFKQALQNCWDKSPAWVQNLFTSVLYCTDGEGRDEINDFLQDLVALEHCSLSPGFPRVLPWSSSLPVCDPPWRFPSRALCCSELRESGLRPSKYASRRGETGPLRTLAVWNFWLKSLCMLLWVFSLACLLYHNLHSRASIQYFCFLDRK